MSTSTSTRSVTIADAPARTRGARLPPHDLVAEECLLGAMLLSAQAIGAGLEATRAADFYAPGHGHVFAAISSLYGRGQPADPVTVADELRRGGLLEASGGPAGLISLAAGTPAISSAPRYGAIVADLAALRRLIGAAGEIAELGYSLPEDVAGAIDAAEARIYAVAEARRAEAGIEAGALMDEVLAALEARAASGGAICGLATGYGELDERLGGLVASNLVIVGGRPGSGKTSLALGLAAHAAVVSRVPTLVVSLEMSRGEIGERLVGAEARVDLAALRSGDLSEADWGRLAAAAGRIGAAPLVIDDDPAASVLDVRARARRLKARGGLGLVVVDYLQLMVGRSGAENRQVEVAEISRGLKLLARELEVPVVALSQLSRGLESRADKRPGLADLRESGALENDADVVLLVYRDQLYHRDSPDAGVAEVAVAKHRNGPTGAPVRLAFLEPFARFANLARPGTGSPP